MKAFEWLIENWYFFACVLGLLAVIWSNHKDLGNTKTHLDDAWKQIESLDNRVSPFFNPRSVDSVVFLSIRVIFSLN